MDDALRSRLESITQRRRPQRAELALTVEGWPPEMLSAARLVWARRVFNETGSIQIATRLRAAAVAVGWVEPQVHAALERLEEDEREHANLAAMMFSRLGGTQAPVPAPPPASTEPPTIELARLVLFGLSVCETVSAYRYAAVRRHTDRLVFRDCIDLFLRDEVVHSELGFLLLPNALQQLDEVIGPGPRQALVENELASTLRELDLTIGMDASRRQGLPAPRPQPPDNPGVVEPAVDARAFYEAVEEVIVPKLQGLGIDAGRAWSHRWLAGEPGWS